MSATTTSELRSTPRVNGAANGSGNGNGAEQSWLSPLNLHWAGVALLAAVNVYLLVQMGLLWHSASKRDADAMEQQRITLRAADISARPLRGLDAKLASSTADADRFYTERLPGADSEMLAELGALTKRENVRLARVTYAEVQVLAGTPDELTEVKMDASLSGDYRPLMLLINSLERDKMFFLIDGVTLTGQESGMVNLRLRLTTYLRGAATRGAEMEKSEASAGASAATAETAAADGGPVR
jgi:type IV pilus assembly protein PilO